MGKVKLESHKKEYQAEFNRRLPIVLEAVGQEAEGDVMETLRDRIGKSDWYVPTGNLMNSITHRVVDTDIYVGSNSEYAVYCEFGTGIYAEKGDGRKTPWVYKGADGKNHFTRGMRPKHFVKDGVMNNLSKYGDIMKEGLS